MSLETAAIIFALLWGPTALWLIFRAVRGPANRSMDSFGSESAPSRSAQPPLDAVIHGEYWICTECRSVNHVGAMRCYSCGVEPPPPVEPPAPIAPDRLPTGDGWVPTMDPVTASTPIEPATPAVFPVATSQVPRSPVDAPRAEPVAEPIAAAAAAATTKRARGTRRSRPGAARTTAQDVSVAAHMTVAPPADPAAAAPAPERAPLEELPAAPPSCPYLGFKDDPATWSSFPDDRNLCHAAAASASNPGRLVRGVRRRGRAVPVSSDHQASLCLTSEHQQCHRYPAVQPAARPS